MKKLPDNQIAFYQVLDGTVNIEVLYAEENIWLTQKKMAELFDCSPDNISLHLKNIYADYEINQDATTEEFSVVQKEGTREVNRKTLFYSLEAIIAVGYRVNSERATAFRKWATQVLKQYAIRGYVLDRKRLENGTFLGEDYYDRSKVNWKNIGLCKINCLSPILTAW